MKAIVRTGYGGPEILELQDVDVPVPANDEVLVRVRASSVNMADVDYIRGKPWVTRLGIGLRRPRARTPGIDMAGEIESIGPGATRFEPGDRVFADLFGEGSGAWAEYVTVPERALTPMPDGISFEEAATVPSSGVFAIQGLRDKRPVKPGERVLVNGASGNVGPFAVQIAKALGAEVTGTCRTSKVGFVRALGADYVLDYTAEDYRTSGERYDLIIDVACHGDMLGIRHSLNKGGGHVVIGGNRRGYFESLTVGPVITLATGKKMSMLMWRVNDSRDMADLAAMLGDGRIRPIVDQLFPLAETPEAMRYLETGEAQGKVVITI